MGYYYNLMVIMISTDRAARALDVRLNPLRGLTLTRPSRGWLRAIRDALGMTTAQFARRLGVSQPRVVGLEKGEVEETLTLASLRRAAEALDCTLVYALVPNQTLLESLKNQAQRQAALQMQRINHTMRLENQALSASDVLNQQNELAARLLAGDHRRLWDLSE